MKLKRLSAAVVLLAFVAIVEAQTPSPAVPVRLEITAEEPLKGALHSCIQKELTTTSSVVWDQTPALTLSIIASEQRLSDGTMLGYLIYAGGYQPASRDSNAVIIQWQILRMAPPDLPTTCARVAKEFTESMIEPTRAEQERLRKLGQPSKRKQ